MLKKEREKKKNGCSELVSCYIDKLENIEIAMIRLPGYLCTCREFEGSEITLNMRNVQKCVK